MKNFIILGTLLLSLNCGADQLECFMTEYGNEKNATMSFVMDESNQAHGSFYRIESQLFPEVKGFTAFMERGGRKFAVISYNSETLQVNSSGQYEVFKDDQIIQHQLIIPSTGLKLNGIETYCIYHKSVVPQ